MSRPSRETWRLIVWAGILILIGAGAVAIVAGCASLRPSNAATGNGATATQNSTQTTGGNAVDAKGAGAVASNFFRPQPGAKESGPGVGLGGDRSNLHSPGPAQLCEPMGQRGHVSAGAGDGSGPVHSGVSLKGEVMRFFYGLILGLVCGPILWANRRALIGYAVQFARWVARKIVAAEPQKP